MFNTYTDMTDAQAREKARKAAQEATDAFDRLVKPDDIQSGADTWDDVDADTLEEEAHYSADIMLSERQQPYHGLAHDLAIVLYRNDTMRVPMNDLADRFSRHDAVLEGYWPNSMNRQEVTDIIHAHADDIRPEYHTEARQTIKAGIVKGLTDI